MPTRRDDAARLEPLEHRQLLAAEMIGTELVVAGTQGDDAIVIEAGETPGSVTLYGVYDVPDGTTFEGVDSLRVALLRGDDRVDLQGQIRDTEGNPMVTRMFGGIGDDKLNGADTTDILVGGPGSDVLRGYAGNDILAGGSGGDWMFGGDGDDFMMGNAGFDHLWGDAGNDLIYAGKGHDFAYGGDGNDLVVGQLGFDYVSGDAGDDVIRGGGHADTLRGGLGNDVLRGGWGPDDLYGGAGSDELIGAGSADTFRGSMAERMDFGAGDAFYNPYVDDPDIAALSDDFWNAVDEMDAQGDLPEEAWIVINGSQTLAAECGQHVEDAANAIQSMSEIELQQVVVELMPVMTEFMNTVGDDFTFDADSFDLVLGLFDQIIAVFPSDVQQPMTMMINCMTDHQQLIIDMADASETLQQQYPNAELMGEFWSVYFSFLGT